MMCIETVNFSPTVTLHVNVAFEMTTYYTFRNPKYGGSVQQAIKKQNQTVEVGAVPGPSGLSLNVEDVIMDSGSVDVTVGGKKRNRGPDATLLGVSTDAEVADLYAASDPKSYDDTAPQPRARRARRVVLPSTDADLALGPPPPAATAAADTAGIVYDTVSKNG